jgi:hypothetical protein
VKDYINLLLRKQEHCMQLITKVPCLVLQQQQQQQRGASFKAVMWYKELKLNTKFSSSLCCAAEEVAPGDGSWR